MHSARTGTLGSALLLVSASWTVNAWAQAVPNPAMPPGTPESSAAGGGAGLAAVLAVAGLLVIIGVAVKLFDLKNQRESESVQLQAQVSDALLREPSLARLRVTPTAHVPLWTGSPATIEVSGEVPTPELKDTVLRIVRDEAARVRSDVQVEDRLAVSSTMVRAA